MTEEFNIPQELACENEKMLEKYYNDYVLGTETLQGITLYSLVQYFKLPSDVGSYTLLASPDTEAESGILSKKIPLHLKNGEEKTLLLLGMKFAYLFYLPI